MKIKAVEYDLNGHTLVLRSAEKEDAQLLRTYYQTVCGETRFLLFDADECKDYTMEQNVEYITRHADSEKACLILAELDGEYVGNASFDTAGESRRNAHRANIGIALYLKYTGMGIGKRLFGLTVETIKKCGFERAELSVFEGNDRAIHLYESFGFEETGRILKANKYDDGTYADEIFMAKSLI